MPLITPVAGPYTSVFNALSLGLMEDGYEIDIIHKDEPINKSDGYAQTLLDSVYQGMDCKIRGKAIEYGAAGVLAMMFPQHATAFAATGALKMRLGQPGILASAVWKTLILTALAGTSASSAPATLTSTSARISPNMNPKWLKGPHNRTIPWELNLFPYLSVDNIFFSTT